MDNHFFVHIPFSAASAASDASANDGSAQSAYVSEAHVNHVPVSDAPVSRWAAASPLRNTLLTTGVLFTGGGASAMLLGLAVKHLSVRRDTEEAQQFSSELLRFGGIAFAAGVASIGGSYFTSRESSRPSRANVEDFENPLPNYYASVSEPPAYTPTDLLHPPAFEGHQAIELHPLSSAGSSSSTLVQDGTSSTH